MSLRKTPTITSFFHTCHPTAYCSSSQPRSNRPGRKIHYDGFLHSTRRTYATVASESSSSPSNNHELHWPEISESRRIPTPYQIFNQSRDEPYSKRRFYELVKIYHPDRNAHDNSPISAAGTQHHDIHLERYRLVIAANAILSDPSKRSAYDHTGHGWSDFLEDVSTEQSKRPKYSTYHRWKSDTITRFGWNIDNDPMYNATWEDWERWYERQRRQYHTSAHTSSGSSYRAAPWIPAAFFSSASSAPQGMYTSNAMFLSVVALLAALGGIGQATHANNTARSRSDRIQAHSEKVSKNLMSARDDAMESAGSSTKGDRIRRWVRERDDYGEGEVDGRTLRAGTDDDVCASGVVADKDEEPFWKRPVEPWERGDLKPYKRRD